MSAPFKRPKFHFGQVLSAEDLNALIDFVHGKNCLTALRHGWGVVNGLEVTYLDGNKVKIRKGSAVTAAGNDIVVAEECTFPVKVEDLPGDLALEYVEREKEPVSGAAGPPDDPCGTTTQPQTKAFNSRIVEGYRLVLLPCSDADPKDKFVPLARLRKSNDGGVAVDPCVRRYFGTEVRPDPEGKLPLGRVIGLDVLEATAMLTRWGVVVSEWKEEAGSPVASLPTAHRGELVRLVSDSKSRRILRVESCEVRT
jgi:hypothetical protein